MCVIGVYRRMKAFRLIMVEEIGCYMKEEVHYNNRTLQIINSLCSTALLLMSTNFIPRKVLFHETHRQLISISNNELSFRTYWNVVLSANQKQDKCYPKFKYLHQTDFR